MKLAVIIVNYGTPHHVIKGLEALLPQLHDVNGGARCWVVDNNSPDDSVKIISDEINKKKYQQYVKLVPHSLNAGFGAGNNVAIRKALTSEDPPEFFYFLNPDAEVMPQTVSGMLSYLEKNDDVGVVGGPLLTPEGQLECGAFRFPSYRSTIEENLGIGIISRIWQKYRVTISPEPEISTAVGWVGGASMMIKRQVLEKVGFFDEGYFLYFEEMDLCKRISDEGYKIHYLPDAKVIHDSGASTGIHAENVRLPAYWHHSRNRYYRKNFGKNGLYLHNSITIVAGSIGKFYRKLRGRETSRKHFIKDIIKYNSKKENSHKDCKPLTPVEIPSNLTPKSIIIRRPHFRKVQNKLFFMASRNPYRSLDEVELKIWDALEQETEFSKLKKQFDQDIEHTVSQMTEQNIIDIFEPADESIRPKIVIIEPHSDDAALSIGATMWKLRHERQFILYTLGSTSNYSSYFSSNYGPLDVDEITQLRNAENTIFMRHVHGKYVATDNKEATLRYKDGDWTHTFLKEHRISVAAFNNHLGKKDERESWQNTIRDILEKNTDAEEIWIPMGVGTHTDHGITRDACLAALTSPKSAKHNAKVIFYQDVPYDSQFKEHKLEIIETLEHHGAILQHEPVEISKDFAIKLYLLQIFGSQFKLKAVQKSVENSARPTYASGIYENFWRLAMFPQKFYSGKLYYSAQIIKTGLAATKDWLQKSKTAKTVDIILLMPSGRWKDHMSFLLEKFPNTKFTVRYSESARAEVLNFKKERVEYIFLPSDKFSWLKTIANLIFSSGRPLLFIAGERRYSLAKKISAICLHRDSIVFDTMENFHITATGDFNEP